MTFASLKKAVNARKWPVLIVCLVLLVAAPIVIQHGLVLTVMIYICLLYTSKPVDFFMIFLQLFL